MTYVIRSDSLGLDQEIRDLLEKSMISMSEKEVQAWMDHLYDPGQMFVMIRDDRPVSCIQVKNRVLRLKDRQLTVSVPVLFCTHPDYRLQRCFGKLMEAVIAKAAANDLALMTVSDQVKVLEKRSFSPVARCREYWLDRVQIPEMEDGTVRPWRREDLYPVYLQFMKNFPVRIQLDRRDFEAQLEYLRQSGRRIWVAMDQWHHAEGFAVTVPVSTGVRFELIVYENTRALLNLLARQARFTRTLVVETGPNEALERLFEGVIHRPKASVMVRLTNWQLLSRWLEKEIRHPQGLFETFDDPMWLGML
ncbi:GNAT family N-acetyltransferase [uncultured Faecalibaculum sp.]|uniref:GNAT family N-acetyltransferase n=1 Tax=uncultured Faecalibaculum sp. TaxID=1729681 RepID=UPI002607908E|nr:GNAT family N-acetyltransferase [uncultured Faecalibaculum sp.]